MHSHNNFQSLPARRPTCAPRPPGCRRLWNQAPARPAREWSMQPVMGPIAPLSRPAGPSGWYGRQGAARRSWVRGLVSVHPPRWLPRPPPAAHTAASGAQRHFHHPDDGEDRCSRRCLSRRSGCQLMAPDAVTFSKQLGESSPCGATVSGVPEGPAAPGVARGAAVARFCPRGG